MEAIERIFELVDTKFKEQKDFAAAIGVKPQRVSEWRRGISTSYQRRLPEIAVVLGVSTDYLLGKADAPKVKISVPNGKWIPVLGDVAAGLPIEAVENVVDYEEIDQAMAATGDYFGLRIKGSSMEPRIREGDVVIVRKQSDVDTGDTAIVLVNGDSATCKRIKREDDGSLWLLPNNPAYEPQHFSPAEIQSTPVSIIGKVVELRAKF